MKIIRLGETDSTNNYAARLLDSNLPLEECCIVAGLQTHGRGIGNNRWFAEKGKNLTFSIISSANGITPDRQFLFNKLVSLAVFDFLKGYIPEGLSIKWPNDIYVDDRKIAGILIHCSVCGDKLTWIISGIGININQDNFPDSIPNPVSISQITGNIYATDVMLNRFLQSFEKRRTLITRGNFAQIDEDYFSALYRMGIESDFIVNGKPFRATISGVNNWGWLVVTDPEGKVREFDMKKIRYVL